MRQMKAAVIAIVCGSLLAVSPPVALGQGAILSGLVDNATDIAFYATRVGLDKGALKPERGSTAGGLGFELAFEIPGGAFPLSRISKKKADPKKPTPATPGSCEAKFEAGLLDQGQDCKDTTYKIVKRTRPSATGTYEETPEIEDFEWSENRVSFEVAIGFTQAGAFVARQGEHDLRASIREIPSVSLYGNFPVKGRLGGYFGARTGWVQLVGGRAYPTTGAPIKFDGSTFQVGGVLGAVVEIFGLNFFGEGGYTFRNVKALEWDTETSIGTLPRAMNLRGANVALGLQFQFKEKKK
jgi:hypothetical protein